MPTVPFLQYLVLFASCKYLWFWAKCLKILFFSKAHFVFTSMETKLKILFFKPKYFFSSSKILFSFVRGWHLCLGTYLTHWRWFVFAITCNSYIDPSLSILRTSLQWVKIFTECISLIWLQSCTPPPSTRVKKIFF